MFKPKRVTSEHPLIVGAGFDGTGLTTLRRVLAILGRDRVALPAYPLVPCMRTDETVACDSNADFLYRYGFQNESHPVSVWEGHDAVMGHPVPFFLYDYLEAFPNARVILTVRDGDELWDSMQRLSPVTGSLVSGSRDATLLKLWVWGMPFAGNLNKRVFLRRYWKHNSKVMVGVPKAQLLVWDMFKDPSWESVCGFLGVPVPAEPFPTPSPNEL